MLPKVIGEHSHPHIPRVGGLSLIVRRLRLAYGVSDRCGSKPPLSPVQKVGEEGGLELDLAGARRLLGEIMMSQDVHFSLDPNRNRTGFLVSY